MSLRVPSLEKILKKTEKEQSVHILPSRSQYSIPIPSLFSSIRSNNQTITQNIINTTHCVISSPEAEIISGIGGFIHTNGKTVYTLPRYHLGVPAQLDMEVAMWQLAHTDLIAPYVQKATEQNSGIIYFAREGSITAWQKICYVATNHSLPTTLASIRHVPAKNSYERSAKLATDINLEGFAKNPEFLFLCDPVASGIQHVTIIEHLLRMGIKPKTILIIAPMASFFGLSVIRQFCTTRNIECISGSCGALLDSIAPLHYFSPYPKNQSLAADPTLWEVFEQHFADIGHKFCIRGNWTASFWGGNSYPLAYSEHELAGIGCSNKVVRSMMQTMGEQIVHNPELSQKVTPFSTKLSRVPHVS